MLTLIMALVGLALGAALGDSFGALTGALLGWLWMRSLRQQSAIEALQKALGTLQPVAGEQQPARAPLERAAGLGAEPGQTAPVAESQSVSAPVPLSPPVPPAAALDLPPSSPVDVPPTAAPMPGAPRRDPLAPLKAWLLGGNSIVKAGVGILFIGLAFLAKYASEHVQVAVEFRLAGIAAVALVLLGLGWRLRHKRAAYAQVLQGGAVAVLYLTLFVAFKFYGVLSVGPVFGLMVVVAALAAALAVLQDSRALAVIGALGGFATPLLVSSGSGSHVALFSYYLVLDLGIAAVAWHKTWRSLNLVGFAGTFLVGSGWGVLKYEPAHYASSQAFLLAFFVLFVVIMLMPARPGRPAAAPGTLARHADAWVHGSLLFGLPTVVFALQYGLVHGNAYGVALSALGLAAFYVLLALWMRGKPQLALAFEACLAIGTVFLTLVIPFALDARSTAGAWALEGAGLVWLGFRQQRGLSRLFGYLLLALAGVSLLVAGGYHAVPDNVFNAFLFNGLMLAAGSLAAAYFVERHAAPRPSAAEGATAAPERWWVRAEPVAQPLLITWATLWLLWTAAVQIDGLLAWRHELAAWLASVSAITLLYTALSARLRWPMVALPTMALAPVLAMGTVASAVMFDSPLQGGGWWAWPLALVAHGVVLWLAAPLWGSRERQLVHGLGVLVVAGLGALQGRAITADWGELASAWAWLGWLAVPAALLLLLPRPGMARRWPVSAEPAAYQTGACAVLAASGLLWTLLANLISDGTAAPLPHLPLLNPLDLGIAVALLACGLWLRSEASAPLLAARPAWGLAGLSVAGFVWLNAILIRAFHHYGGVPFELSAWSQSFAVQTGLTLLWTTTALVLMWGAARRAARVPWLAGAVLLGAVVLKLLLVDLAGSGTVTRIVSFIGVGVLMLVIGYVAPWPGNSSQTESDHAVG